MDENRELTEEELNKVVGGARIDYDCRPGQGGQGGLGGQSGGQEGTFSLYKCTNKIKFSNGNIGECAQYFLSNFPNAPCPREGCGCTDSTKRILIQ